MTEYVAVVREPWLTMLATGRKHIECRVGSSQPHPASRVRVSDVVHLRPVGGAPVCRMRVARVYNWGRCTRNMLKPILSGYRSGLGVAEGVDLPYLTDHDSAYPTMVWLADPEPSTLVTWPRYHPWALVRESQQLTLR